MSTTNPARQIAAVVRDALACRLDGDAPLTVAELAALAPVLGMTPSQIVARAEAHETEWACPDWCSLTREVHIERLPEVGAYVHEADVTIWGVDGYLPVGRDTRADGTDSPHSPVVLLSNLREDELTPAQARSLATSLLIAADMADDPERPHPQHMNWSYRGE